MSTIDKEQLKELASDPEQTSESIREALGVSNLYYELQKDPVAKAIFDEGRVAARAAGKRPQQEEKKVSTRTASKLKAKGPGKKTATTSTPPRNGNAKGGVDRELLRKIILEFNHIDVYGTTSEHFNDVRQEMGALL